MWVRSFRSYPTKIPHNNSSFQEQIRDFGKFCGYNGSHDYYFGSYGGRKGAVGNMMKLDQHSEVVQLGMDSRFMNCGPIRFDHYTSHDDIRLQMPGGIFCSEFDPDVCNAIVANSKPMPAFQHPLLFDSIAKKPLTDKPDYVGRTLLRTWGDGIKAIGRPLESNRSCPFLGCDKVFGGDANDATLGEYTRHVVRCDFKDQPYCCDCGMYDSATTGKERQWLQNLHRHLRIYCEKTKEHYEHGSTCTIISGESTATGVVNTVTNRKRRFTHFATVRKERCPVEELIYGKWSISCQVEMVMIYIRNCPP